MTSSGFSMKRYTLLRRTDEGERRAGPPAPGRPGVRRLTLVRRAQVWPPLADGMRPDASR